MADNNDTNNIKTLLGLICLAHEEYKFKVYRATKEYSDQVQLLTDLIQKELTEIQT